MEYTTLYVIGLSKSKVIYLQATVLAADPHDYETPKGIVVAL